MKSNNTLITAILCVLVFLLVFSGYKIKDIKSKEDNSAQSSLEREMFYASYNGDYLRIRQLVEDNANIDLVNIKETKSTMVRDNIHLSDSCWERTPLMLAAKMGKYKALVELINSGADIHAQSAIRKGGSGGRRTPLIYAIKWGILSGDVEGKVAKELVSRGVEVNQSCCKAKWTPLMFTVELLYNIQSKYQKTNVKEDVALVIADRLKARGANPYALNKDNHSPITMLMRPEYVLENIFKKDIETIGNISAINYTYQQKMLEVLQ